jgi:hypothetical protein
MSEQYPVFVEVRRGDGSSEQVRVGTATKGASGFLLQIGELSIGAEPVAARLGVSTRNSASGDTSGGVLPNYGRAKGMPIRGAALADLEFYLNGSKRSLSDPSKARFHDKERQMMAQIEAEIARQLG